ncbi:MAG: ABC transporter substrate-binding protein [Gloeomargarita sp. SKYB31]|nr:ABC transporter substrate-binding protein [Gloeomargarita sp. SKYB31]
MAASRFRQWMGIFLGVILATMTLAGCSLRQPIARVPQLVLATPAGPATFNYPLNTSFYSVFGFIYEGLLQTNGVTLELEPGLAESWEISPDKKRIVFTLRENLRWSDGQPLTADDVVFSFRDVYLNPKIPSGIQDILRVGQSRAFPEVRALNQRQVEFRIPEPFAPFLRFVGGIAILPAHLLRPGIETLDAKGNPRFLSMWGIDTPVQQIVGNGPYVMERFTPGQRVVFRRNPYYWQKDEQGEPLPYIKRIIWQIIESTDTQLLRFMSQELDAVEVTPEAFQLLKKEAKRRNFTVYNAGPETLSTFIAFNLNRAQNAQGVPLVDPVKSRWFNNHNFRQAVAYGINRERMKNTIFRGLGVLQNSPIHPASPYYYSGVKVYEYNPQKARELLKAAGFSWDEQGRLRDDRGNVVRFTLLTNIERRIRPAMAAQIKQDLARLGMQVDIQTMSFNPYVEKLNKTRDWECYLGGFGGGGVDPHSGFNIWYSQGSLHTFNQGPLPGQPPLKNWSPSSWELKIDELMIRGSQEMDEEKRKAIYAEFQQVVQEELPFIYLVNNLDLEAIRNRVKGIEFSALSGAFWNLPHLQLQD